jgi:hypothetical protein
MPGAYPATLPEPGVSRAEFEELKRQVNESAAEAREGLR